MNRSWISSFLVCCAALSLGAHAVASEQMRTFWRGQWVSYVEVQGHAVTEGDIIIGPIDAVREWTRAVERGQIQREATQKALTLGAEASLWSNRDASGVVQIAYTITTADLPNIQTAINEVNRVLAGVVQWIPRTSEVDYVDFNLAAKDLGSCNSFVGKAGGKQSILGDPICGVSTLVHEMGHAMGLWHVQQDARAKSFVDFRLSNMDPAYRSNNQPIFGTRTFGGYDYDSNMHYSRTAFSASQADRVTLETNPPGITLASQPTYSPSDLDALFRLYGRAPTRTIVQSNPSGMRVFVDGVSVITPATFDWPIGSVHRVWVEDGLQTKDGYRFAFGRWSHDAAATPSPQLTWQVRAGDGGLGAPTTSPSDTLVVANFIRLVDVQTTAASQTGGSSTVSAVRAPWPGTASLFPQFSKFELLAQPSSGYSHFFTWGSAFASRGGGAVRPNVSLTVTGNLPLQAIGASFHNGATIALDVEGPGTEDGIVIKTTPPGSAASSAIAPRIARTTQGDWKFEMDSPQYVGASIRYIKDSFVGFDDPVAGTITMPPSGVRNASVRANREVRPFRQVQPSCAGSVSLSDSATWLRTGSPLNVTLNSNGVGVFTGWSGTLTGTATSVSTTVGSNVPEFVARFNQIAEPLTLQSVTPPLIGDDSVTATIELRGTGFTPTSQVTIGNLSFAATYVNSTTLRATVSRGLLTVGRQPIFVRNALSFSCIASSDSAAIDVLQPGARAGLTITEFYNQDFDYYFMTGRDADKALLDSRSDWRRTGSEFKAYSLPTQGTQPFERFFFANAAKGGARGTHFYTSLANEQRYLTTFNVKNEPLRALPFLEGVEGYMIDKLADGSCPSNTLPVYRAFRGQPRYVDDANHRFSTSPTQHQDMVTRLGWIDEGVVFCSLP